MVLTEKSSLRALLNSSRSARLESADVGDDAPLCRPTSLIIKQNQEINLTAALKKEHIVGFNKNKVAYLSFVWVFLGIFLGLAHVDLAS